jgi:hypothetical protein
VLAQWETAPGLFWRVAPRAEAGEGAAADAAAEAALSLR